jgi:DNA-directed RNA polymerase subunit beta'
VNKVLDKKALSSLIDECYRKSRNKNTVLLADRLRTLGFEMATRAGISVCMDDMLIPDARRRPASVHRDVATVVEQYQEGLITDGERYNKVVDIWAEASDQIARDLMEVIGSETSRGPGHGREGARAQLQLHLHDGRLRCSRFATSRSVSSPVCAV